MARRKGKSSRGEYRSIPNKEAYLVRPGNENFLYVAVSVSFFHQSILKLEMSVGGRIALRPWRSSRLGSS